MEQGTIFPYVKELLLYQKKIVRILAGVGSKKHCWPLFISPKIFTVGNKFVHFSKSILHQN